MDATLKSLAGFDPIEQPEPDPEPEVSDDEIDELAVRIERQIQETEEFIEDLPDFPPRPQRVGGTIDVDTLVNA